MRYRLRTLLIAATLAPAILAGVWRAFIVDPEMTGAIEMLVGALICLPAIVIVPLVVLIVAIGRSAKARRSDSLIAEMNKTLKERAEPL